MSILPSPQLPSSRPGLFIAATGPASTGASNEVAPGDALSMWVITGVDWSLWDAGAGGTVHAWWSWNGVHVYLAHEPMPAGAIGGYWYWRGSLLVTYPHSFEAGISCTSGGSASCVAYGEAVAPAGVSV